jgi:biotin-dependent carboxylase-like uncharacterized protein
MIEVLSTGAPNLIQDLGRWGHLKIGVSRSGAMDLPAFSVANALVGNAESAAAIEVALFPFRLRFERDTTFACTGADCPVKLDDAPIPPWWARPARAGQTLVVGAPVRGARAYVAVRGGIDVPLVLGSRSTDLKNGIGGFQGRGLRRGDKLNVADVEGARPMRTGIGVIPSELPSFLMEAKERSIRVRVLAGAEYEHFSDAARKAFESSEYTVTPDANRMGYRLSGEELVLTAPLELLSHGIVPGTVQVPPSGQPIVQLAEANTCGGYPKIANVIEADLWRLAQAPIGCRIRFTIVGAQQAGEALRAQATERALIRRSLAMLSQRA